MRAPVISCADVTLRFGGLCTGFYDGFRAMYRRRLYTSPGRRPLAVARHQEIHK